MSLLDRLGVNLDKTDAKAVEDGLEYGNVPHIGLHHAVLDGVREISANTGSQGFDMRFKIIGGPAKGMEVKEALWISEKEKAKHRVLLFMHRLGLLTKVAKNGQEHYLPVAGKTEFSHCLGVECVIEVGEHEKREHQGKTYTDAKLAFAGVLSLDDKRCEKVPRGTPGVTTPATQTGGGGAAVPPTNQVAQQTFDDI